MFSRLLRILENAKNIQKYSIKLQMKMQMDF